MYGVIDDSIADFWGETWPVELDERVTHSGKKNTDWPSLGILTSELPPDEDRTASHLRADYVWGLWAGVCNVTFSLCSLLRYSLEK